MAEAFLTTKDIHKSFNSQKAVNGVSLFIEKGEIFGLLGPNGAGRRLISSYCLGRVACRKAMSGVE